MSAWPRPPTLSARAPTPDPDPGTAPTPAPGPLAAAHRPELRVEPGKQGRRRGPPGRFIAGAGGGRAFVTAGVKDRGEAPGRPASTCITRPDSLPPGRGEGPLGREPHLQGRRGRCRGRAGWPRPSPAPHGAEPREQALAWSPGTRASGRQLRPRVASGAPGGSGGRRESTWRAHRGLPESRAR